MILFKIPLKIVLIVGLVNVNYKTFKFEKYPAEIENKNYKFKIVALFAEFQCEFFFS